jgi:hypothetical protein
MWSLLCLAILAVSSAIAQPQARLPTACDDGFLQTDAAKPTLARVIGPARVRITRAYPGASRAQPYLVAGDEVVVLATSDTRACVVFTAPTQAARSTSGWLDIRSIQVAPAAPEPTDWSGTWRCGAEQEVSIRSVAGDAYRVEGQATWGASDPERVKRGGVNSGEVSGIIHPTGAQAEIGTADDATDCHVRLWRLGPYLAVADHGGCGGLNVSFTGVYRNVRHR